MYKHGCNSWTVNSKFLLQILNEKWKFTLSVLYLISEGGTFFFPPENKKSYFSKCPSVLLMTWFLVWLFSLFCFGGFCECKVTCFYPTPLSPSLFLCFLLVVTTRTITHSTLSALSLPDSPPGSSLLSLIPKIVTLYPWCTVQRLFHINLHSII